MSLEAYGRLSDKQILILLLIEFDEDGRLIREERPFGSEPTGSPARASAELPSQAELGLSERLMEEMLWLRPLAGAYYVRMFFQTWKNRGESPEEIADRYRAHVASDN